MRRLSSLVLPLVLLVSGAWAQTAISAHSGLIHYVEGQASLDSKPLELKFGDFPEMKNGQLVSTEDGRAEILLTPGAFVRLDENSSFRMISNKLADTSLEMLSGSSLIEVDELLTGNAIGINLGNARIEVLKKGLYRIDSEPSRLRVYEGEANVILGDDSVSARKGREVTVGTVLGTEKFDTKDTDAFYRWGGRRAEYISRANISAAHSSTNGYLSTGSWAYNQWFGMYTYLPGSGYGYSPFGWAFYSPGTVYDVYNQAYYGAYLPSYGGYRGASVASQAAPLHSAASVSALRAATSAQSGQRSSTLTSAGLGRSSDGFSNSAASSSSAAASSSAGFGRASGAGVSTGMSSGRASGGGAASSGRGR